MTKCGEKRFIKSVPGAADQAHSIIAGAGHFIQNDAAEAFSQAIIEFVRANPTG